MNSMSALPLFDTPDISRRKHLGNPESRAAVKRIAPHKSARYQSILFCLERHAQTAKEYAADHKIELNTVSGRFSELKAGELIISNGDRRDGSAVLRLTIEGARALISCQLGLARIVHEDNAAKVVKI